MGPSIGPQRPSVGPQLPGPQIPAGPQLPEGWKREEDEEEEKKSIGAQRPTGPQLPGPQLPPPERKFMGPTMPPAPLDQMPSYPANPSSKPSHDESSSDDNYGPSIPQPSKPTEDEQESSDDDFGPRPPPASTTEADEAAALARLNRHAPQSRTSTSSNKPQREEWMLAPPSSSDLTHRMDPTKLKSRKFQSGKGAKAPSYGASGGVSSIWTETPEEKRKRLADEVMGVARPAYAGPVAPGDERSERVRREEEERVRRMREEIQKTRGESLVKVHSEQRRKEGREEEEDDPSKRAFDWEKDMKGRSMGNVQKREMMNRAKDFGGRFDSGRFL